MQCVTEYPKDNFAGSTEQFYKRFKLATPDLTTIGDLGPIIAISKGAKIIEKHFTLNKNFQGPDHSFSRF